MSGKNFSLCWQSSGSVNRSTAWWSPWLRTAAFSLCLRAGVHREPEPLGGLSGLVCEMVQRGAGNHSSRDRVSIQDNLADTAEDVSEPARKMLELASSDSATQRDLDQLRRILTAN